TDEFVAEVKRKVNEDGNKSYANGSAPRRPSPTPSTRTWATVRTKEAQDDLDGGDQGVQETQAWLLENPLPLEPGLVAPQLP
ncbi:Hypothetical protein FKW44_011261, partial [Caligus rogercresseyi]